MSSYPHFCKSGQQAAPVAARHPRLQDAWASVGTAYVTVDGSPYLPISLRTLMPWAPVLTH